jgi:hypothetical protein
MDMYDNWNWRLSFWIFVRNAVDNTKLKDDRSINVVVDNWKNVTPLGINRN